MKTIKSLITAFSFLIPFLVLAAGGGGGGGGGSAPTPPPACSADAWTCSNWSECATSGTQTRSCQLTNDCLSIDTPQPTEIQTCTPPLPPPLTTPLAGGEKSISPPSGGGVRGGATQTCSEDTWNCAPWSACNKVGHQTRTCRRTFDCPAITTPRPFTDRLCPGLKCGQLPTLKERIKCRLQLSPEDFTLELSIQYAPELCRAQTTQKEFAKCTDFYRKLAPCWNEADGKPRILCAKRVIGLPDDLQSAKQTCLAKTNTQRTTCLEDFKEKIIWLTLFRMYNLEVTAELLISHGAPWERVADFDTQVEEHKIALYAAKDNTDRVRIVQSLQTAWRFFIENIRPRLVL